MKTIKKTYRKLALKNHPDKGGNVDTFKKITEAYEFLSSEREEEKLKKTAKVVEFKTIVQKGPPGLGLGLMIEMEQGGRVRIKKTLGLVEAKGEVHQGDILIGIDGINVRGLSFKEILDKVAKTVVGQKIEFEFSRMLKDDDWGDGKANLPENHVYVDPTPDPEVDDGSDSGFSMTSLFHKRPSIVNGGVVDLTGSSFEAKVTVPDAKPPAAAAYKDRAQSVRGRKSNNRPPVSIEKKQRHSLGSASRKQGVTSPRRSDTGVMSSIFGGTKKEPRPSSSRAGTKWKLFGSRGAKASSNNSPKDDPSDATEKTGGQINLDDYVDTTAEATEGYESPNEEVHVVINLEDASGGGNFLGAAKLDNAPIPEEKSVSFEGKKPTKKTSFTKPSFLSGITPREKRADSALRRVASEASMSQSLSSVWADLESDTRKEKDDAVESLSEEIDSLRTQLATAHAQLEDEREQHRADISLLREKLSEVFETAATTGESEGRPLSVGSFVGSLIPSAVNTEEQAKLAAMEGRAIAAEQELNGLRLENDNLKDDLEAARELMQQGQKRIQVLIFCTKIVLTNLIFCTKLVLTILRFCTKLVLTLLIFCSRLVLTILIFCTTLVLIMVLTVLVICTEIVLTNLIFSRTMRWRSRSPRGN
jgi:hypothetical protein